MSLPKLISKMSGRTPRFVTVEGRVIPGAGVVASGAGFRHPQHGHVTNVVRHTNHGGEAIRADACHAWWEIDPELLVREALAMAVAFPTFRFLLVDGAPAWRGTLNTGRGRFEVTIVHRPDHRLPHVVPSRPGLFKRNSGGRTRRSPHLFDNDDLCVAGQADWKPAEHDATVVIGWTAHWLASFTEWRITGRGWPCPGVDVDAA